LSTPDIIVVFNPSAKGGKSKKIFDDYINFLTKTDTEYDLWTSTGNNDSLLLQKKLDLANYGKLSVIGGDGTLNMVINAIGDREINVHLIPAGSGNDFAKMIYKRIEYPSIYNLVIADPPTAKEVDTWSCNNHRFINIFGVGFDGSLVHRMAEKTYNIPTKLKYWLAIFNQLFTYRSQSYFINNIEKQLFMVAVANGQIYGGDFRIAPKADCSDGLLEVIQIKKIWTPLRIFYLPILQAGKHLKLKITERSEDGELHISSDKNILGQLDGEPISGKRFEIKYARKVKILS
jgi:diacylglycerol kinase family enzyme